MVNFDVSGRIALVTGGGHGHRPRNRTRPGRVWGTGDPGGPARVRGEGIADQLNAAGGQAEVNPRWSPAPAQVRVAFEDVRARARTTRHPREQCGTQSPEAD